MASNLELTPSQTPVKIFKFLSPQASNFCFVCHFVCTKNVKINLWKKEKLSRPGEIIESIFDIKITNLDSDVLCKNCWRRIETVERKRNAIVDEIKISRVKTQKYVRSRFKRGQSSENQQTTSKNSRKKLSFESITSLECNNEKVRIIFD